MVVVTGLLPAWPPPWTLATTVEVRNATRRMARPGDVEEEKNERRLVVLRADDAIVKACRGDVTSTRRCCRCCQGIEGKAAAVVVTLGRLLCGAEE